MSLRGFGCGIQKSVDDTHALKVDGKTSRSHSFPLLHSLSLVLPNMAPGKLSFLLFLLGCLNVFVAADQGNYYADDQYQENNGDDAAEDADEGDDAAAGDDAGDDAVAAGDDSTGITYWTDYAILPKRCIV